MLVVALTCVLLPFDANGEDVQRIAPSFRLADEAGRVVDLEQYRGNIILVCFWATWCVSCRESLAELDLLRDSHRDRGFVVIGINVDGSPDRAAAFLKKRPVGFPVLMDTSGAVAAAYSVAGLPVAFLIGRDGLVARRYQGSGKAVMTRYEQDIEHLLKRD